ncbi:hypothetical protein KBX10_06270 [Corynebacterium sp. CCUG 59401]|nr:hypothetical protein [Corynebacterium pseudogenitalium]
MLWVDGQHGGVGFGQRLLKMGPGRIVDGDEAFDITHWGSFACHVHPQGWVVSTGLYVELELHGMSLQSYFLVSLQQSKNSNSRQYTENIWGARKHA